MINRTPMTGMQPRANQQGGRAGVHYGRNPHAGGNGAGPRFGDGSGAPQRRDMTQPRVQPPAPDAPESHENAARSQGQHTGRDEPQSIQSPAPQIETPPAVSEKSHAPDSIKNPHYLPGHLSTWAGKTVRAEFLIGNNIIEEKLGTLTDVGANYIVLKELETRNQVLCDIHSIKFITVLEDGY